MAVGNPQVQTTNFRNLNLALHQVPTVSCEPDKLGFMFRYELIKEFFFSRPAPHVNRYHQVGAFEGNCSRSAADEFFVWLLIGLALSSGFNTFLHHVCARQGWMEHTQFSAQQWKWAGTIVACPNCVQWPGTRSRHETMEHKRDSTAGSPAQQDRCWTEGALSHEQ
jgi:hypothetical protein